MRVMCCDLWRIDNRWHNGGEERILLSEPLYMIDDRPVRVSHVWHTDGTLYGFLHDGGTIPAIAQPIVGNKWERGLPAYILHDYLWAERKTLGYDFATTNRILHAALLGLGVGRATASTIKWAVDTFGPRLWRDGEAHAGDLAWHYAVIEDSD